MGDIILERRSFKSCKECSSSDIPIPEECPLWHLDSDAMVNAFNFTEGIHHDCPYVIDRKKYDITELNEKWDELIKKMAKNDSITSQLINSMNELNSNSNIIWY